MFYVFSTFCSLFCYRCYNFGIIHVFKVFVNSNKFDHKVMYFFHQGKTSSKKDKQRSKRGTLSFKS